MLPYRNAMAQRPELQGGAGNAMAEQPLIDRMTMLPIGQYEDGSLTLAWPQMLVDMYEGGVRSFEQGRQLPRVDSEGYYAGTPRAEPLDAFNAASAAPMAGVAGRVSGAVPKGALGSGGSDVMRVAANDANASAPSIALNALRDAPVYVSDGAGGVRLAPPPSPGFYPAAPPPAPKPTPPRPAPKRARPATPGLPMDDASRLSRANAMGFNTGEKLYHGTPYVFDAFDASRAGSGLTAQGAGRGVYMTPSRAEASLYGTKLHELYINPGKQKVLDNYPFPDDHAFAREIDRAMDEGFESVRFRNVHEQNGNGPQDQVVVVDPSRIRSTRAAFDPARSDSAYLLAANPETASYPSLLLNSLEKPQGIRAYHGSPHDFDKFDLSKIGTGEGAQAYGHGLYFAESPAVADSYREGLSFGNGDTTVTLGGKKLDRSDPLWETGLNAPPEQTIGQSIDYWKKQSEYWPDRFGHLIDAASDHAPDSAFRRGRMYEVNINAQPEQFLDWDLPLPQQSNAVKEILRQRGFDVESQLKEYTNPYGVNIVSDPDKGSALVFGDGDAANFAARMKEAGIPGIKYLDQGSRAAGQGSHNYVVFDDSLIDIMRKYANPETAAAPSLLLNSEDGQQNPLLANADPAYDANALVEERWRDLPKVQGDPSAYGAGYVDPAQMFQQQNMDPLDYLFRPQPPYPPRQFR